MNQPPCKIWYIYKITNIINGKNYIGQAIKIDNRWRDHRRAAILNKPTQLIHHALIKYGINNFNFEVIACCKNQEDANDAETQLVAQYNSYVANGHGYNVTYGGYNAPKSEIWKKSIKRWRDSLSEEERLAIRNKQAAATKEQIQTKGHPAQGYKWTEEQRKSLSEWRLSLDQDSIYTPEIRKKMSDIRKSKPIPEEQRQNMLEGLKKWREKRLNERYSSDEMRCHAPNCNIHGKALYVIVNDIRYCSKHGQRLKRNGHFELLPKKPIVMTEEIRCKISKSKKGKNLGRVPHNKIYLTEEQIKLIINDSRSIMQLSKELGLSKKVISRILKEYKLSAYEVI